MELATRIREIAAKKFIRPALAAGKKEFSIAVRDLMAEARAQGISTIQRTPPFCTSIQTRDFLVDNGLEVAWVDGPSKKLSTTVVIHYRVTHSVPETAVQAVPPASAETPEQRAFRLTEKLRGLMKDEIAAHGGAEGYLRWVRGEDEAA
jgi:hypothetical protein